jgi:hypothetical protein
MFDYDGTARKVVDMLFDLLHKATNTINSLEKRVEQLERATVSNRRCTCICHESNSKVGTCPVGCCGKQEIKMEFDTAGAIEWLLENTDCDKALEAFQRAGKPEENESDDS